MFGESQGWPFPKGPNSLVTTATVNAILDDIEAGPNAGRHYSAAPNAGARAAWPVVARHCPALTEAQVGLAVATWVRNGMINTDQGSQFTSGDFTGMLAAAGIRISMDGRGRWIDNVFIERLWRSLNTRISISRATPMAARPMSGSPSGWPFTIIGVRIRLWRTGHR